MALTPRRSILLFWSLLLVPTLVLAAAAFMLLDREQERMGRAAADVLEERARAIADTIHITVETLEQQLAQSLTDMAPTPRSDPLPALLAWEKVNPLVRHVFVFQPDKGLAYPLEGMAATRREQRFAARYDPLFSGGLAFDYNAARPAESGRDPRADAAYSNRKSLLSLARNQQAKAPTAPVEADAPLVVPAAGLPANEAPAAPLPAASLRAPRQGWLPWFSDNSLCILGWVRPHPPGPIYGIELETMTLLSRLVVDFPVVPDRGVAMVLKDGSGNILHQSGPLVLANGLQAAASLAVSPLLPHWRMEIFLDPELFQPSNTFFYLALAVLALLLAAILTGGIAMTRYSLDQARDARQKTSFVSSVSHELKTPLTSIRMYAELLLSKRITDDTKRDKYLRVMVSESRRLTRLINNVLDFGRLEQGRKTYRTEDLDLPDFLRAFIADHRIRMEKAGLGIHTRITESPCPVNIDPDALSQVLLNLVDNVIKYASDGKSIRFELAAGPGCCTIAVRDRGPGVPDKHQKRIFEKFHRVDNSLTAAQPGSGLGLAIARQIMQDLGGDLALDLTRDRGTRPGLNRETRLGCSFIIRIPKS